ncbi:MAG: 3-hydroxyacyl-CoA dehydrogenase [Gemmatimonadetes bacterium]|nr:3-hydroxyacyl-CoA dehydrogenase [Gemmatimonadota bacterium]
MTERALKRAAVVGSGVIGRSWARVFARAGWEVSVYDADPERLKQAVRWAHATALEDERAGFLTEGGAAEEARLIRPASSLDDAVSGARWVQESGPERLDLKQDLFAALDAATAPGAILASSTSALDIGQIAKGLEGASRCCVAHPVNPPHVVPVVEVLPGPGSPASTVERVLSVLRDVGQSPVLMSRFVPGFLLNRMQAALVREAVSLVETGTASVEAVDRVIREGLGLRWALMGPFGTGHTNADDGVGGYFRRYGAAYRSLWDDLDPQPALTDGLIDEIQAGVEAMYGNADSKEVGAWRDRMVGRIRRLKDGDPGPAGGEARAGGDPAGQEKVG